VVGAEPEVKQIIVVVLKLNVHVIQNNNSNKGTVKDGIQGFGGESGERERGPNNIGAFTGGRGSGRS